MSINLDAIATAEAEYGRVIAAYARWEYRAIVLQNSDLPDRWRDPRWTRDAACRTEPVTAALCAGCPVQRECLAAALVIDHPAPIRAGLTHEQRRDLFDQLATTATQLDDWIAQLPGAKDTP